MNWRFGLYDNTFDPLWMTDWALAAVLLLPMVFALLVRLGLMGHEFSRAVVVVLWLVSCGALTFFNSLL